MTEHYWQPKWALPYGPMGWKREPGETRFKIGPHTCATRQEFVSSTMTKSCADLLTLLTGRRHDMVNRNLTHIERGMGKEGTGSHLQNHLVVATSEALSSQEMLALSASFCHNDPPGLFGFLKQRLFSRIIKHHWPFANTHCGY